MADNLVKSAARALEILELFAERREPLNATQIATTLGYPKSSLSVLLKSLITQGYLSSSRGDGGLFPTLKLTRLGDWVPTALLGSETLLPLLLALRDRTGETVTLTIPVDLNMRCIYALIGTHPIALQVEEGVSFPTIGTAIGTMFLATQPDTVTRSLFDRWVKQGHARESGKWDELQKAIASARTDGYSSAYDIVLPDTGAIAMPIRAASNKEILIVGVAGLNYRIHQASEAIRETMRALLPPMEDAQDAS
ncbi:IclR family transcriptional regulator [Sphingomonas sp. RB1R13]|uniref:IclR family transcriptional regulator n=1 Tax=Sphingomonas sp. RB1R13 TaxID=3096159 RepID=UPI002FCB8BBA